jgi:2-iminobutanoate/2-iminopropanoate deaminase
MEIGTVTTTNAPKAGGHYSQAITYNGLVFVSGQLPIDPVSGEKLLGPVEEQTEQCLKNIDQILKAAGSSLSRTLKMTIYVSDMESWAGVNKVYERMLGEHRPARAVVGVKELHYGFKIEIEAIAALS